MVLKINDDEEPEAKSAKLANGTNSKPTTSAAASSYYPGKRSSSSSSSSSSECSESSSDFEHSYKSLSSRIGKEFQVDLAEYETSKYSLNDIKLKETLVWKPSLKITDQDLEKFIHSACTKHAYTIEQALALLCWDQYDFTKASLHMKSYVPVPNEWTEEDKILFEQAYMFHGKNFTKIRQVLPDKTQASLVKFYYMWKKGRQYTSLIDSNQSNNKTNNSDQSNTNDLSESNGKDDLDEQKDENDDDDSNFANNANKICCNCDLITVDLQSTPKGMLCGPCYVYWKDTGGLMRPDFISKSNRKNNNLPLTGTAVANKFVSDPRGNSFGTNNSREAKNFQKSLRKPPKGIYLNYEELVNLVEVDSDQTFDMLNKKLYCLKKEVQQNKQLNSNLIMKLADEIEPKISIDERLIQMDEEAIETPCWTAHEISLVIQGFNKYGNDFVAISQVLQTKSENSVKSFFNYYKEHLNLDKLVLNNPKDLKSESTSILNELTKLNRPDLPTIMNEATKVDASSVKTEPNIRNNYLSTERNGKKTNLDLETGKKSHNDLVCITLD